MPTLIPQIIFTVFLTALEYVLTDTSVPTLRPPPSGGNEVSGNDSTLATEVIYGRTRKGGVHITPPWTHGTLNNSLSIVLAMAAHEVTAYSGVYIDSDLIPIESISTMSVTSIAGNTNAWVNSGNFKNLARLRNYMGYASNSQFVDWEMFQYFPTQCDSWFRGAGIAYTAATYDWGDGKFWSARGLPELTVDLFGKKVYDPRRDTSAGANPTSSTYAFPSSNPALCWADFKTNTLYGRAVPTAEIDYTAVVTAANICDTPVAIANTGTVIYSELTATATTGAASVTQNADGSIRVQRTSGSGWDASVWSSARSGTSGRITFSPRNQTGIFVMGFDSNPSAGSLDDATIEFCWYLNANTSLEIKESGTSKLTISTNYSADGTKLYDTSTVFSIEYDGRYMRYFINSQLVRTRTVGTAFAVYGFDSSLNNATVDVYVNVERRYTCNGFFNSSQNPNSNEQQIVDSMIGHAVRKGGLWVPYAGATTATTFALNHTDFLTIDLIEVTAARDDGRYNGVRTYYIDPLRNWQRVECYPRYSDIYKANDAGERIWLEFDQGLCNYEYEAQRKGEIRLRQSRNGTVLSGTLPPKFLNIATYDTVTLTFAELNWSAKIFRVVETTLMTNGSQRVVLREEQAADWTDLLASEYSTKSWAGLPDITATQPAPPTGLTVTVVGNSIGFGWELGAVVPQTTVYQLWSYPGSLSDVASKVLVWQGDALGKTVALGAGSPQWYQTRAVTNSYASGFSPSTYGVIGATTYTTPSSSGVWGFSVSPATIYKMFYKNTGGTFGSAAGNVSNGTTPVYSWVNPTSVTNIKINFPGSATTTFTASGMANYDFFSGNFYCNVVDGGNVSSKACIVTVERDDAGSA